MSHAAAFFDVDGTLTRTTVLHPLLWYQRAHLSTPRFAAWWLGMLARVPYYLMLDRASRGRFNIAFYRRYAGIRAADLAAWHRATFADNLGARLFPSGVTCVQEHQRQGHRIVLVTGGLNPVIQPLAEHLRADRLFAMDLVEREGVLTGELARPPIADEEKAAFVRSYAWEQGIDLAASFAYGNSWGDAPMMACVGHPVAVNPDGRLATHARERGWDAVRWMR